MLTRDHGQARDRAGGRTGGMGDVSSVITEASALSAPWASGYPQPDETDVWLAQAIVRETAEAIVVTDP
jgi:hypothetical protein